jgi:DNA-binding transcriptional LysR family regulator
MTEISVTGLRVLREVAAQGSFTAAAKTLGYTQSAVSRQVAGLEGAAGTPLFERSARGVRPTDAGEALLQRAGIVLDELDAAQRELAGITELATGRLGVGAFPTAMAALVPRALAGFRAEHPTVRIGLREGVTSSQVKRLISGVIDVAVIGILPGAREIRDRRITLEHLIDDPLLLAVGREHPLARRRSVDVDDLADESWIAGSSKASDTMIGPWQWAGWQPRVELIAKEWTGKLGLVAAGLGVTLVPGLAAAAVRRDVALVRIRSELPARREVSIATMAGNGLPPFVGALAELLHETATKMTAELQRRIGGR